MALGAGYFLAIIACNIRNDKEAVNGAEPMLEWIARSRQSRHGCVWRKMIYTVRLVDSLFLPT
jgi:hypothetical protein